MPKKDHGITLIELIVSMALMSLVVLSIYSIELFSRHHVISSDKRAKVQNEISYAIEYMSKYVQQSIGDSQLPAIRRYPSAGTQTGFQIGIDLNNPQTPKDLSDDTWVNFYLSGNSLIAQKGASSEVLTGRISGVFAANTVMPNSPGQGFYVNITDPGPNQGIAVDIGLVGRYNPTVAASADNPQVSMKTRLVSPSSSAQ
ncbi:MAG: prepilin-type N-terminal cleavage/methylation domain-containing protein [Candidatus Omnitrophica bacterium]|nr:prepilin-type N-terminal cleavage/methylation domain-containing protein [Candidatus Omnitrophota bacterium]